MARPRVRYDEKDKPVTCTVRIPVHLAKYLYREALRARKGQGGNLVEESDIVIRLIERWTEGQDAVDWDKLLNELKEEAEIEKTESA